MNDLFFIATVIVLMFLFSGDPDVFDMLIEKAKSELSVEKDCGP